MGALLPNLSLLLCLSLLQGAKAATFTISNQCSYTVWPGILSNAGVSPPSTTGFSLSPGKSLAVSVAAAWSGRIWGRTLCATTGADDRSFTCATGDCGSGTVECSGRGAAPPATLAEFTLSTTAGDDFYDVSLVDGYNLPMLVSPSSPSPARRNGSCQATGCVVDLNKSCPEELRVTSPAESGGGGEVVAACKSACEAFGREEYCCSGEHGSPSTCAATAYSRFFKGACPRAYSYAYDDATSTFTCASAAAGGGGFDVVFCPAKSSLESDGNPEAVSLPPYSTMSSVGNAQSLMTNMNSHVIGLLMVITLVISTLSW